MAILLPKSLFVPPMLFAQTKFPSLSNLETKMSLYPELTVVRLNMLTLGSKSTVLEKYPVV